MQMCSLSANRTVASIPTPTPVTAIFHHYHSKCRQAVSGQRRPSHPPYTHTHTQFCLFFSLAFICHSPHPIVYETQTSNSGAQDSQGKCILSPGCRDGRPEDIIYSGRIKALSPVSGKPAAAEWTPPKNKAESEENLKQESQKNSHINQIRKALSKASEQDV